MEVGISVLDVLQGDWFECTEAIARKGVGSRCYITSLGQEWQVVPYTTSKPKISECSTGGTASGQLCKKDLEHSAATISLKQGRTKPRFNDQRNGFNDEEA